ncbi:peptide chain release factor 1 [Sporosarcina pasteurii]|uniref:Peptide chain release factor 1 n=1 Tax=Sporosarcina pasteurii TaxID=1474 RepID=A0A380BED0_SPOPA|nr:peptide chain release factor 1 [Sporosarcina pasteurii]MDS9472287.1 peptide chain release factor 1 [Sporosarcina pasteurii]QBQ06268.1 peptide chain release factor 1 [Sporosarcina pasteurii]SUI99091.1 Peptide chain release factor 1 [Sporosarcina pasteurii]
MFERLQIVEDRYEQLNELLSDPDVVSDATKLRDYSKEQSGLQETVDVFREYKRVIEERDSAKSLLEESLDDEMKELVTLEISELEEQIEPLEEKLRILLIPKDPNDDKNVIMEVRGAAGGDEAALFAGNLYRMYSRYAEMNNWKIEVIDSSPTELGGFKEIIFMITGNGAYSRLKFENGAHRVQRVPETESGGRTHTSTATVACLPEAEDVDIEILREDLKIDTYRSSGAGGQHVNTTDSAVRITHLPTGIVVSMQDEKSQIKNREKAMKVLKARVYDAAQQEAQAEYAATRKSAVGTGDRSERIRTYNYPQNRVTDHRIGLTIQKLDQIIDGSLDEIIDALIIEDQAHRLESLNTND